MGLIKVKSVGQRRKRMFDTVFPNTTQGREDALVHCKTHFATDGRIYTDKTKRYLFVGGIKYITKHGTIQFMNGMWLHKDIHDEAVFSLPQKDQRGRIMRENGKVMFTEQNVNSYLMSERMR